MMKLAQNHFIQLMRLNRPIGIYLLLLPCIWSINLAGNGIPNPWLLFLFSLGAIVMRSAGCVYNDIIDQDIDKLVERTKYRPLAAGIISRSQATSCLLILLGFGFSILIQLNLVTIVLGIFGLGLVLAYPWMKRITYWPQAFLGVTFNFGAILAWTAATGDFSIKAFYLYIAGICWTLIYDTIYAHQDISDDLLIGVKSSAIILREKTKPFLLCIAGGMFIFLIAAKPDIWNLICSLLALLHAIWQILTLDIHDTKNCLARFKANKWTGFIIAVGMC